MLLACSEQQRDEDNNIVNRAQIEIATRERREEQTCSRYTRARHVDINQLSMLHPIYRYSYSSPARPICCWRALALTIRSCVNN